MCFAVLFRVGVGGTLLASCCHVDVVLSRAVGVLYPPLVFKSPVLWTRKKLDLDRTGLEKTGLPVAVH